MKKITAIIIVLCMMASTLTSCSSKHFSFEQDKSNNEYITKSEWAEMLGTYFGMDSCLDINPYFKDVLPENPSFAYIQSCVEWEVFDKSEELFKPEEYATIGFVVESAIKASEVDYENIADEDKPYNVNDRKSNSYATREYSLGVLEWAYKLYTNREFKEYENVKYKENVINLPDVKCDEAGKIVSSDIQQELKEGDVIVTAPTENDVYGVAKKIESVSYNDSGEMIIETKEPEIGDLYEELDFACVGRITDPSTVQTPDGITLLGITQVSNNMQNKPEVVTLAHTALKDNDVEKKQMANKGTSLSFSVKKAKGKKSLSNAFSFSYGAIETEFEKEFFDKTGLKKPDNPKNNQNIKAEDKYDGGWEIEGSLTLNNFYVEAELKTKKMFGVPYGIKSYDYEIHYEVESSLKFSGNYEEEITIALVPIPLGSTGVVLDVEIYAKGSINGDVVIAQKIANTTNVKYTEENGYKKTQSSECDKSVEISVNFKIGFGGKTTVNILGIDIINFQIDVGLGFEASAKLTKAIRYQDGLYKYNGAAVELSGAKEEWLLCVDGTAYFPTVSLSIGTKMTTLAYKVGLKFTWKIMDKSGATFKSKTASLHYEDGKGIVDECSLNKELITDEEVSKALEEDKKENENKVGSDVMNISQYAAQLENGQTFELFVTQLPYGYTGYDVRWQSEDESIIDIVDCKADEKTASCKLVARGSGVTSISINTADEKHPLKCAVIVKDDNKIEYTPIQ